MKNLSNRFARFRWQLFRPRVWWENVIDVASAVLVIGGPIADPPLILAVPFVFSLLYAFDSWSWL